MLRHVVVGKVFAGGRQLVVHQVGERLAELHEEPLSGCVAVGVHVEGGLPLGCQVPEQLGVGPAEQGGRWYGYGLVPCREHGPAVGAALGDVERLALLEHGRYGQVVDGASCAVRKPEARHVAEVVVVVLARVEVSVLHANQLSVGVVIGNLQPMGLLPVGP